MRASWIALILLTGLFLPTHASGADEPAQDHVTAECTVVRMSAETAHEFSVGHNLSEDAEKGWIALQTLIQAQKAELVTDLTVVGKLNERATGEAGMVKLAVESIPSSIPGGMMTDIQVRCENHTTTTSSNWKAHAERFFGPYESTWKDAPVIYLVFLRLRSGGV